MKESKFLLRFERGLLNRMVSNIEKKEKLNLFRCDNIRRASLLNADAYRARIRQITNKIEQHEKDH